MPTGSLSNLPFFKDKHVGNGLNSRIPPNMARQQGQFVHRTDRTPLDTIESLALQFASNLYAHGFTVKSAVIHEQKCRSWLVATHIVSWRAQDINLYIPSLRDQG